jgi:glutamate formiminotransferase/formiminotetrahydrofolate cyclodeaminase
MPAPLVECVPNFSEGRRPEIVEAIKEAIASVKGVFVLDYSSDPDHNRSVITFVGSPKAVEEGAFRGIAKAAELIDLNQHTGEHPRLGAADVVPFIPISGVKMKDCVEIANRLGHRVGEELDIPVYLYEQAARRPERRRLENIRRGEYEGIKAEIATDPDREPDFGPKRMGSAGGTVIGAREFLIAYNVYLATDDIKIAQKIARTVRHSSGGLRYVKALGMLVDGLAQVSMNLTNFRKTPLPLVVETIRREALRYGVNVHHSELIGLIPQDALVNAAVWYTQMDQFSPEQVLEQRMYAVLEEQESEDFLDALAAGTPTPGGGSAAARAGAMAAGLVSMVARLTIGKKAYSSVATEMETLLAEAESLREELTAAVAEDADAFKAVMDAYRLPKDDRRTQAIQEATLQAAEVPLAVARKALRVMRLALQAAEIGNVNAITDAGVGLQLASTALTGAGYNVRINLTGIQDEAQKQTLLSELQEIETDAAALKSALQAILTDRGGLPLA